MIRVLALMLLLAGCARIYHKNLITLLHEPFNPASITFRTDGYYYTENTSSHYDWIDYKKGIKTADYFKVGIKPIIFYTDGFVKKDESVFFQDKFIDSISKQKVIDSSIIKFEDYILNEKAHELKKGKVTLWDWGVYRQKENKLELQYYINHFGHYRLVTLDMVVINDSTILALHKFSPLAGMKPYVIDESLIETYKFRKFSPKPDSANYLKTHSSRFAKKKN